MISRAIGRFPVALFEQDSWDMGAISAFFGFSSRIINMSSICNNDEFCLVGRVPREK